MGDSIKAINGKGQSCNDKHVLFLEFYAKYWEIFNFFFYFGNPCALIGTSAMNSSSLGDQILWKGIRKLGFVSEISYGCIHGREVYCSLQQTSWMPTGILKQRTLIPLMVITVVPLVSVETEGSYFWYEIWDLFIMHKNILSGFFYLLLSISFFIIL